MRWNAFFLTFIVVHSFLLSIAGHPIRLTLDTLIYSNPGKAKEIIHQALNDKGYEDDRGRLLYFAGVIANLEGDIEKSLVYLKSADTLAIQSNEKRLMVDCQLAIGEIIYNQGNYTKALQYFLGASTLSASIRYTDGNAAALNLIGKYYHSIGNFERSKNYFLNAGKLVKESNNYDEYIRILNNLGKHYESIGNRSIALEYYQQAYQLLKNTTNKIVIGTTLNHLGNIYHELGEFDRALSLHFQALHTREAYGYIEGISKSENNLGEVFESLNEPDSAMKYYHQSLLRAEQIGYRKGMIKAQFNLGIIHQKSGRTNEAIDAYQKSIFLARETGYEKGLLNAYASLAGLYIDNKEYEKAEPFLKKGKQYAREDSLNPLLVDFYYLEFKLEQARNNPDAALKHYIEYAELKEAMTLAEKENRLAEYQVRFETEMQKQKNELLIKENQIQTLALKRKNTTLTSIGLILLLSLVLAVILFLRMKNKQQVNKTLNKLNAKLTKKNLQLLNLNKELDKANREKDKLFSIISHELRNPLWWFKNLTETLSRNFERMEKAKAQKAIESLNESAKNAFHLTDNLLQWSRSQIGRLTYSPANYDLSLLLEQLADMFSQEIQYKSIQLSISVENPTLVYVDKDVICTVIRNLFSNAIKYTPVGGKIHLYTKSHRSRVTLYIQDSGIGITEENQKKLFDPCLQFSTPGLMQEKGSGLGLLLCKDFLELSGSNLQMKSSPEEGTTFYFVIPTVNSAVSAEGIYEPSNRGER